MTSTDRRYGVYGAAAFKIPCRVAALSNITLSGLQDINGVTLVADDRVLVTAQTSSVDNGIYVASTGTWARAADFNGPYDVVKGTLVRVAYGIPEASIYELTTTDPVIGTTALTFSSIVVTTDSDMMVLDPATYQPTGGGMGEVSVISNSNYSHFARSEIGRNGRIHTVYYRGLNHGQDDPDAVCTAQLGYTDTPMSIDGTLAVSGVVTIITATYPTLYSVYDLSGITFTIVGTNQAGGAISASLAGPNATRVTFATAFKTISSVTPDADLPGEVQVGLLILPSNIETRYSDDGGATWSSATALINGLVNGTERGYQAGIAITRTGTIVIFCLGYTIGGAFVRTDRFVSYDNGASYSEAQTVTYTGLQGTDDRVVMYSRWRALGDGRIVSVGALTDRSYSMEITEDNLGSTIACTPMVRACNSLAMLGSYEIDSIDAGTDTVTLKATYGDVTAYWPANMSCSVVDTGAADVTTYALSSSFSAGTTKVVLNSLSAGTVGADSRLNHLYGAKQILSITPGTNTFTTMYDQTASLIVGSYIGVNGTSVGADRRMDGLHGPIVSVTYNAGTSRSTIVVGSTIDAAATADTNSRLTALALGEWGFDCLSDLTWAAAVRANGMPSRIPVLKTETGHGGWEMIGEIEGPVSAEEGSTASPSLDFIRHGPRVKAMVGAFYRGGVDKYVVTFADAERMLSDTTIFSELWAWRGPITNIPSVIDSIDAGANTVTIVSGDGDLTARYPVGMRVQIENAGGANDATTYVTAAAFTTNTVLTLTELDAGTITAASTIKPRWPQNSGYQNFMVFGSTILAIFGEETQTGGLLVSDAARVVCQRLDIGQWLSDVTYSTRDPLPTDNIDAGYSTGSEWINSTWQETFKASQIDGAAVWQSRSAPWLRPVSGRYYGNEVGGTVGTQLLVQDRLYLVPVFARGRVFGVDRLGAWVTGAGIDVLCQLRLGIYADNDGKPDGGALVVDGGTVNMAGTAGLHPVDFDEIDFGPGAYWLAVIANINGGAGALPTIRAASTPSFQQVQMGFDTGNLNTWTRHWIKDETIASWAAYTLPATCPVTTEVASVDSAIHLVYHVA